MNETEELIKAALTKHVEGTPHPGPILNALSTRRRRVRPTLIAIIAAAAVAVGIALPIAMQKPEASAPPAHTPMPVEPSKGIKMRYVLQPLPGFTERNRAASLDGSYQVRTWMKDICPQGKHGPECVASLSLLMYTAKHPYFADTPQSQGDSVVIGAGQARVWVDARQTMAKLTLRPAGPDTVLHLSLFDPAGDTRRKIIELARTIGVDNTTAVQPALSFGWLPAGFTRTVVGVRGGSPSTAEPGIQAQPDNARAGDVEARIVPKAVDEPGSGMLAVTLPDGRQVQIQASGSPRIPLDQLRRIAENLAVEPAPDLSWVGK
ncbi:hypothetical protein LWC34_25285 [Kibdelosporangium philippinense]|uniref:Uncharacterized protein n=1 Tax=Kibdelosporangium philippinense TaxID=211113 RepID=A0ABS8ZE60_9PSEU|nr:hypothetical protein [Kibdelosporangium philippinense]MCE7006124.1 hypothetical protein [Kibdelosporangium philippinense]